MRSEAVLMAPWQGYRGRRSSNAFGMGGAVAAHIGLLLVFLWSQHAVPRHLVAGERDATVLHLAPLNSAPPSPPKPAQAQPEVANAAPDPAPAAATTPVLAPSPSPLNPIAPPQLSAKAAAGPAEAQQKSAAAAVPLPPAPPAPARDPSAAAEQRARADWLSLLVTHLAGYRRYPRQAESARQQGTVVVAITVDRHGRVAKVDLVRGSGFAALDAEALATPRRATPLPPPSAEISGDPVVVEVPILFAIRR